MSNEESGEPPPPDWPKMEPPTSKYVVGIGASAGGLESLENLFRNMPTQSGMSFVIIQHLSPDFKSMMNELLARDTSMRIFVVEDGCRVEPDTIYLMPPKKQMIIADGCLHLSDKQTERGLMLPIDHFLESLARELGPFAIGIILSGSGSDGTRGIEEVSKQGGLVICESLDTARFDGMPSSAQATGLVDLVLPPSEIGQALHAYAKNPGSVLRGKAEHAERNSALKGVDAIIQLFRNSFDIDFSSYRETTVMRRIRRRLDMLRMDTLDQYVETLHQNPSELRALYQDLLIGVTQFFRDPDVFHYLATSVIPELLTHRKDNESLRVWVAGCATGEEAYSIAIAFHEAIRLANRPLPLKIFATDVHKRSIDFASRGLFSQELLKAMPEELLERYFVPHKEGYQVRPEIRQMIVYAPHNVLRDAPFTDLDFVSCRNMLIYLQGAAQRRAISLFHYGLRVQGVLLLGTSESTGELASEFESVSDRFRIYRKSRDVRLTHNLRSPLTSADAMQPVGFFNSIPQRKPIASSRSRQIQDELLNRFMPPSILIDASRSIIDTFSGAEKLLKFPTRRPTLDILDLVDRNMRTTLAGAIGRAMKNQAKVRFGKLYIDTEQGNSPFDLSVMPFGGKGSDAYYLIVFTPLDETTPQLSSDLLPLQTLRAPVNHSDDDARLQISIDQIRQLEDDLRYSRENLQATIEELETSNEELQATNEELIASNEELQSTNEELHSLNEELYSVNAEHQRKIEQLAELNRDMNHLLENTDVATVFLDNELRIRRFTSRVREIFELIDDDVGRSIHTFGSKLRIDDLGEQLQAVLNHGKPLEREVLARDGTTFLMRVLPYRTRESVSGVVVMWIDISSLEFLRGRLRWLSAIVESTNDAIIGLDLAGIITSWNRGAEYLYGYTASEIVGKNISLLVPGDRCHEVKEYHQRILGGETVLSADTVRLRRDGSEVNVSLTVSPVFNSEKQVIGISKIARDIGQRIEMEQKIRGEVLQRERFLATLSHELRNPLNAISSAAAIVSNSKAASVEKTSAAESIGRQVGIISHLLADLLDVARIAENRITLDFSTFDLRELVPAVKEVIQVELERHGCTLEFDVPHHPVMVTGDRTRLIQVQVNLIHNAAKYSATTQPIRVRLEANDAQVHLTVADDGQGIPPDKLESIFEPFAQLDESRTQGSGGLGIGLSLTKSLVQLHGGRILAESEGNGKGTIFHVWLPRIRNMPFEASTGETSSLTSLKIPHQNGQVRSLHICVVEDMDDSRDMIKTLLELDGHRVSTAANGTKAIEVLTSETLDFALVDIGLPDISGYEVVRHVRKQLKNRPLKMIALTGYGQTSDVAMAVEAGFDDHIVKPIDITKLQQLCTEIGLQADSQ